LAASAPPAHAEGGRQHAVGADKVGTQPQRFTRYTDCFRNCGRHTDNKPRPPSVPAGLLHSRARLCQFFEPALDLGAGHREILELAVVEPVQGDAPRR